MPILDISIALDKVDYWVDCLKNEKVEEIPAQFLTAVRNIKSFSDKNNLAMQIRYLGQK